MLSDIFFGCTKRKAVSGLFSLKPPPPAPPRQPNLFFPTHTCRLKEHFIFLGIVCTHIYVADARIYKINARIYTGMRMYLSLEEHVHSAVAPHSEVRLHALHLFLQEAVEGPLREHAPPCLDGNGRRPEAAAIFPDARVNPVHRTDGRGGGGGRERWVFRMGHGGLSS